MKIATQPVIILLSKEPSEILSIINFEAPRHQQFKLISQ